MLLGLHYLVLISVAATAETINSTAVTNEDLLTFLKDKFENITEELALVKSQLDNVKIKGQRVQSDDVEIEDEIVQIENKTDYSISNESSTDNWRFFKDACIKDHKYQIMGGLTLEECKHLCAEEGGRFCKSITYHKSTSTCHLSRLGSTSDAYTQPCYLEGYDVYEYDDNKCPRGYYKPEGSYQCYYGCPGGFFMVPAPSNQCLKFFNETTLSWDDANKKCLKEGLVMARPHDALTVRQYITERYGGDGVQTRAWLGARGNGSHVVWQNGDAVSPNNPLWWPNHPGTPTTNQCMQLLSDDWHMTTNPGNPYAVHDQCTDSQTLHALCELVNG